MKNVQSDIRNSILLVFGEHSPEYKEHRYHSVWLGGHTLNDNEYNLQSKFKAGIPNSIIMLKGLIKRLEERLELNISVGEPESSREIGTGIFIVHGHDSGTKESAARLIQSIGLSPIILHEQPNRGMTLIEKFETHAMNVGFAVVLLTPDDVGRARVVGSELEKFRARQNVIFELGFFLGKLGRSKVCAVIEPGVEKPSDYEGVVYIEKDERGKWKHDLAFEIRAAGYKISLDNIK